MTWRPSFEARTTSRPPGDMDIEPTGCSTWNELSSPNVGLSKAEVSGFGSIELGMLLRGARLELRPGLSLQQRLKSTSEDR